MSVVLEKVSELFLREDQDINVTDLLQSPFEACKELERRQKSPGLKEKVEAYLSGDIPDYFRSEPILYLARHVNTPNFETIRFVYLMKHLGMKAVVSHDSKGKFAPHNHVKRALCKLPVCRNLSQKEGVLNEQYQNLTIVDFNSFAGKPFTDIRTVWGEPLVHFHRRLFSELGLTEIESPDDAAWIDRHYRDNLLEHYKHLLSLFVVHGIFFENYDLANVHEAFFVETILRPACDFVEASFGHRPLIVPVFPTSFESNLFWISYPAKTLDIVRKDMGGEDSQVI